MEKKQQSDKGERTNILPWIRTGEYKSPEWQKRIKETREKIRQPDIESSIFFYPRTGNTI